MQDEIWHQFGIQNYNGNVLSVYSVVRTGDSWLFFEVGSMPNLYEGSIFLNYGF